MYTIIYGRELLHVKVEGDCNLDIPFAIQQWKGLLPTDYYCTQNGRPVSSDFNNVQQDVPIRLCDRLPGGKGGFGSMLRAIGAQIEKTTNREACRDLSGRRLRDINEEKRLKAYLDMQQEEGDDEQAKAERRIVKLLSKPKHVFEDKEFEHQRSELVVLVDEELQEGLQKANEVAAQTSSESSKPKESLQKRKLPVEGAAIPKKKKMNLWLGADDLSSSSDTDDSDTDSNSEKQSNEKNKLAVPT